MPNDTPARKQTVDDLEAISIDSARDALGDLVLRSGFKGERIVITRHGRPTAAIVSMEDLDRLLETAAA